MLYRAKRPVALTISEENHWEENREPTHVRGRSAPVTGGFSDFQCPPCWDDLRTLAEIEKDYGTS